MASKKITQMTPALSLEDSDLLTGVDLSKVGGTPTEANVKIERQNLGFAEDDDPRLSDARTPTAHASTHGAGQSDAVTVTSAQVSDFNTAVASNSAVSANTNKVSADGSVATHSDVGLTGVAEGNALIWRTNQFEPEALPSGVSDHGDLSGLADDDHTQYFNAARGDVRYLQTESDPVFTASPAAAVKNDGVATEYLNGTGAYSTPAGGGGGGGIQLSARGSEVSLDLAPGAGGKMLTNAQFVVPTLNNIGAAWTGHSILFTDGIPRRLFMSATACLKLSSTTTKYFRTLVSLYKNGVSESRIWQTSIDSAASGTSSPRSLFGNTAIIEVNGTTDEITIVAYVSEATVADELIVECNASRLLWDIISIEELS